MSWVPHDFWPFDIIKMWLNSILQLSAAVIVGGIDMMSQALMLAKKPHIIIGNEKVPYL